MVKNYGGGFQTLPITKYLYSNEYVSYIHKLCEAKVSQNTNHLLCATQTDIFYFIFYCRFLNAGNEPTLLSLSQKWATTLSLKYTELLSSKYLSKIFYT